MASNFKILYHRDNDRLHLKPTGDMDGDSAYQMINFLEDNSNGVKEVVIETNGLKNIFPFGRHVFSKNFYKITGRYTNIMFAGDKSSQIAPEENLSL